MWYKVWTPLDDLKKHAEAQISVYISGEPNHDESVPTQKSKNLVKAPKKSKETSDVDASDFHTQVEMDPSRITLSSKKVLLALSKSRVGNLFYHKTALNDFECSSICVELLINGKLENVEICTSIQDTFNSTDLSLQVSYLKNVMTAYSKEWPVSTTFIAQFSVDDMKLLCLQLNSIQIEDYIGTFYEAWSKKVISKYVNLKIDLFEFFKMLHFDLKRIGHESDADIVKKIFFVMIQCCAFAEFKTLLKILLRYLIFNDPEIYKKISEATLTGFYEIEKKIGEKTQTNCANSEKLFYSDTSPFTKLIADIVGSWKTEKFDKPNLLKVLMKKYISATPLWINIYDDNYMVSIILLYANNEKKNY